MQVKDYSGNYGDGWIKLYRSIRKHWIHKDPLYFRAWCDILIETNHEPQKDLIKGQLIDCDRGQKLYSLQTWKNIFGKGWSIQKVRTFFKLLEKDNMIMTEGLRNTTRLTVLNYKTYQDKTTTSQQAPNKHLTSSQQAPNNNRRIKELKNDKNDKKKTYSDFFEKLWSKYPRKDGKKEALKHFNASVKNKKDCESIEMAVNNYIDYLKENNTESRYIKKGSTFFNNWQDWMDAAVSLHLVADRSPRMNDDGNFEQLWSDGKWRPME